MTQAIEEIPAKPETIPAPPPGIYYDIPAAVYFSWDAVNASFVKKMVNSCAAIARYETDNPKEPTPAMLQGSVCHTQLFEPEKIDGRYVVAAPCAATTGKGDACGNKGKLLSGGRWYCGRHDKNKTADEIPMVETDEGSLVPAVIDPEMILNAQQMAIRARWDHKIRDLLIGARFEVCIVWVDAVTGVLCKARLDIYRPDTYQLGDLKTTDDASEEAFERTIGDMGYDIQAAMYLDAAASVEGVLYEDFIFIAQEKNPPYVACAYRLKQESIALGRDRYRQGLMDVKWCRENNYWPGYSDHVIKPIGVSRFFYQKASRK